MKILFFVTEDWYFWSHRLPLARALVAEGHAVSVATRVGDHGERIEAEGFELFPVDFQRKNHNPVGGIPLLLRLTRICRRVRPELVHNVALKPAFFGTLAARLARVPRIVNTIAGLGHLFTEDRKRAGRFAFRTGMRHVLNCRNGRIIVQNPDDLNYLLRSGISSPERIFMIRGSGVKIDPTEESQQTEVPLVICHSRMLWSKGIREFVEAGRLLKRRGRKVRMVLAGAPDDGNPESIPASFLQSLKNEGIIEYWGYRRDIPQVLKTATISLLPSYREGLPKSLLEAASLGLPLVAFDVPGCREVVRHMENGLLVPPKDVVSLAGAIEWILDHPEEREKMGRKSREIAVNEFSEEIIIRQTMEVYASALKKTG